ncbi:hypothetical protein GLOIN_2v1876960 [Rhizophagus irregularis DAOM 181602=DAOM 197198]|nr:hypothetical protein GLOIN_2v1876960 [Rhizophagus irregularis DAOM 181602=DAOM 197198]
MQMQYSSEKPRLSLHNRILWRNIWDFNRQQCSLKVASSILSTLIACLPNESKRLLYDNDIFISTPTSKPLLFNYAAFCKVISIYEFNRMIDSVFKDEQSTNLNDINNLVTNQIIKMFANQISSLKKLTYHHNHYYYLNISFPYFPGARDLSELCCSSKLPSNFFYQLSQICHNLQSISISFDDDVSNELKELISSQNNLKKLSLSAFEISWANIIPALTKHSHTITKLQLYGGNEELPLSFLSLFLNLQEFIFSFFHGTEFEDFRMLQYPKLQVLKIPYQCPRPHCQYLESIKIWCDKGNFGEFLSEKEVLETVAKYSPNNFCELKIYNCSNSDVFPGDLESFFISWGERTPKKLLSLIILVDDADYYYDYISSETLEIIGKYEDLGVTVMLRRG